MPTALTILTQLSHFLLRCPGQLHDFFALFITPDFYPLLQLHTFLLSSPEHEFPVHHGSRNILEKMVLIQISNNISNDIVTNYFTIKDGIVPLREVLAAARESGGGWRFRKASVRSGRICNPSY